MSLHALPGDPFDALGDPNRRAIVELLAGIVLVGGGALFLLLSRASDRRAAR